MTGAAAIATLALRVGFPRILAFVPIARQPVHFGAFWSGRRRRSGACACRS